MEACGSCGGATSKDGSKLGSCQTTSLQSILKLPRRNGLLRTDLMANWWPLSQPISFPKQRYFCTDALGSWCTTCPVVLQITGSTVPVRVGPLWWSISATVKKLNRSHILVRQQIWVQHIYLYKKLLAQIFSSTQCKMCHIQKVVFLHLCFWDVHVCITCKATINCTFRTCQDSSSPFSCTQVHAKAHHLSTVLCFLLGHYLVSYYLYVKYRILAIATILADTTRVLGQICHLLLDILGENLCFADFVLYIYL